MYCRGARPVTVQCSAVQCSAVQCSAVQCSAVHGGWNRFVITAKLRPLPPGGRAVSPQGEGSGGQAAPTIPQFALIAQKEHIGRAAGAEAAWPGRPGHLLCTAAPPQVARSWASPLQCSAVQCSAVQCTRLHFTSTATSLSTIIASC
jgi:hypothetical protein